MLTSTSSPQLLLRMGSHAERFYFEWAKEMYDVLVLNANLVEGTPAACASLVEVLDRKPYLIDPITHAFALPAAYLKSTKVNRKTGEKTTSTKRTFQRLAARYGEPVAATVGERAVTPEDFKSSSAKRSLVERVLAYQLERLEEERPQSGPLKAGAEPIRPAALIVPYFFMDAATTWYEANIAFLDEAVALKPALPLYAVVSCDRSLLQDWDALDRIATGYRERKVDGFLLWISDLAEKTIGKLELDNLIRFTESLCSDGRPTYNMYGGYLSALLKSFGLTGFCHGVGYGERRNVLPVLGGGVPLAKYYLPPLHQAFVFADAQSILAECSTDEYYANVCSCPVCQSVIGDNFQANFQKYGEMEYKNVDKRGQPVLYQTANSIRFSRGHCLAARFTELQSVREGDLKDMVSQLGAAEKRYQHSSGFPPTAYLRIWAEGINKHLPG